MRPHPFSLLFVLGLFAAAPAAALCPASPAPDCRVPGKSKLAVTASKQGDRDKLGFAWTKGAASDAGDFGAPAATTDYAVCLYGGSHSTLLSQATVPAGAGWKQTRTGYRYRDRQGTQGGIRRISLRAGAAGKAKVGVSGRGIDLADGALPAELPLRLQLTNLENDVCWEDGWGGEEIRRSSDAKLRTKGRPEDPGATLPVLRTPDPLPGLSAADAGVPAVFGGPVVAKPLTATMIPAHPILDNDGDARIHNDVYNSAVYDRPGPLGAGTAITSVDLLPPDHANPLGHVCATLAFHDGYVLGTCIQASVVPFGASTRLVMLDPDTLEILAEVEAAPRPLVQNSAGGAYFSLDQQGRLVIGPANNAVETWQVEVHGGTPYFVRRASLDVSGELPADDLLQDTVVDWAGRYWFLAISGIIGYVDPATGAVETFDMGEGLQNSMAVDQTGIYVVSFEALYKFTVAADGSVQQAWRAPYDAGTQQLQSPGSGTTPTLFGEQDDLIGICDNADTRVNLFIRDRGTGAEVCTVPLFRDDASACENTLVGHGDEAAVPNNAGYPGAFEVQNVIEPGLEKYRVRADRTGCDPVWINDASVGNSAQLSTATGLIYGWGPDPNEPDLDAWYFTANDWETGEEVFRIYAGNDTPWNPAVGQPHLSPEGVAYIGTLHGIARIAD